MKISKKNSRPKKSKYDWNVFKKSTMIIVALVIFLGIEHAWQSPTFSSEKFRLSGDRVGGYQIESDEWIYFKMPFVNKSSFRNIEINMAMNLPYLHPKHYRLIPDDCLLELKINDKKVNEVKKFCNLHGKKYNLGPYLKRGVNKIQVKLQDGAGLAILDIRPISIISSMNLIKLFMFIVIGWYGFFVLRFFKAKKNLYVLLVTCLLLAAFLKFYDTQIISLQYSYDSNDHLGYISHVLNNWTIPLKGWGTHNPPLYYFTAAAWLKITTIFQGNPTIFSQNLEFFSWLLMIMSLALSAWIACLLFPKKEQWLKQSLFVIFVGVLPGIVLFTSRVSNDVLAYFLGVLFLLFLLRWWQNSRPTDWYISCLVVGLGLLTKNTFLPMIPILLTCLLFKTDLNLRQKAFHLLFGGMLLAVIPSWYLLLRFTNNQDLILGSKIYSSDWNHLRIGNSLKHLLVFNPVKVIQIPYNNTWGEFSRREFFWEFFFRSMLFAEFGFGKSLKLLASVMVSLLMPISLITLFGVLKDIWKRNTKYLPMLVTFLVLILTLFSFRIFRPYVSSNDFRYISPIVIPLAFYLLYGMENLPKIIRIFALGITISFCSLCIVFIFLIF